jgi:hypothetical protein
VKLPTSSLAEGQAKLRIKVQHVPPVRNEAGRYLFPREAHLALWWTRGEWHVDFLTLTGHWATSTGRKGLEPGRIMWARPLSRPGVMPQDLADCLQRHIPTSETTPVRNCS